MFCYSPSLNFTSNSLSGMDIVSYSFSNCSYPQANTSTHSQYCLFLFTLRVKLQARLFSLLNLVSVPDSFELTSFRIGNGEDRSVMFGGGNKPKTSLASYTGNIYQAQPQSPSFDAAGEGRYLEFQPQGSRYGSRPTFGQTQISFASSPRYSSFSRISTTQAQNPRYSPMPAQTARYGSAQRFGRFGRWKWCFEHMNCYKWKKTWLLWIKLLSNYMYYNNGYNINTIMIGSYEKISCSSINKGLTFRLL